MAPRSYFLMSPPGPRWALRGRANFRSVGASDVSAAHALAEWISLADAIEARGGRVICLVPDDAKHADLTGLPFAAECGQIVERAEELLFLLPNMTKPHRIGERALWEVVAADLEMRAVNVEGTWEAQGDVAQFEGRTLLFFGVRTDRKGADSAARFFENPIFVELREPAFHGNMAALPIDAARRMLVCREVMTDESWTELVNAFGEDALALVTEEEIRNYATNGLPIGHELLAPSLVPARVRTLVEEMGVSVLSLPMDELCGKAGGASRCLVSRFEAEEGRIEVPRHLDYRSRRDELRERCR